MSRGHVGLVAFYFPPSRASGVYRMLALANHLVEQDFEVTVFTVTPDFFEHITRSSDESLLASIDPRVAVERIPLPMQHLETHPRRFSWLRGNFPELHRKLSKRATDSIWLDQYGAWVPGLLTRMFSVHRRRPLDVVLATGNPYSSYQAPWLFKKATGVPYVLDSRDSWTLDLFTDELAFPEGHPAYTWEKRTFEDAELICFVNQPLLAWHQRAYPADADKMIVVANGYDTSVVRTLNDAVERASGDDPRDPHPEPVESGATAPGVRFGYVGTLTGNQPHEQVWAGWREAKLSPQMATATMNLYGHLGFFGVSRAVANVLPTGDPTQDCTWHGPVAKADIAAAYAAIDVLVMIVADSPYVTSGKVFEYMATGKPIVGLYEDDCAVADVLAGYPLIAKADSLEADDIARAFREAETLAHTATDAQRTAAKAYAERFERVRQMTPLVEKLGEIAARPIRKPRARM
ncbi:glycosyltransferase [Mobilicoccus massiliensis]|uniref:glycosyltransferase n=1 Tax=Mobilicoccus massiliensis TaxID=1522310 RepID=UPI00058FF55F|nr:glycosyltransferase [Mobilicoccus massiliensis]